MPEIDEVSGRHLDWQLFRRFVAMVRPYWRQALASLALLPLIAAAKLVQPYLIKLLIDDHIVPGALDGFAGLALLFLLALIGESLLLFAQGYLVQAVGQRLMNDLRRQGFRRLLRLPAAFFDRHPSGRLVTRLTSDVENVGELFGAGVIATVGDLVTLVFIVGIMIWMSPPLTLVSLAVIPPLLLILLLFRRNMRSAMRKVRARLAGLNAFIAERIGGISEVRLFGQQRRTLDEFEELQQAYRQSTFQVIEWDAALYAVVEALGAVAIAAILWKGGGEVVAGVATFGTLVAFIEYVQKFFAPLRDLSAKYSVIQASNASLERIFGLLDEIPEPAGRERLAEGSGEVVFEKVDFSYDGRTPVLKGIDLRIGSGETVALVGATGSGKSTLTRLLMQFYRPTAGRIRLDGIDLSELDPREVRRQIGWVSQEPFLFSGSVRDNLDPEGRLDDVALQRQLDDCRLGEVVRRLGGLDGILTERGRNLSSGERQLLCLARALATDPRLLILDEATSRLDSATEHRVAESMAAAGRGRSVLLIAHRLRTAAGADRIVVLHRGQVCESGSHRQLLEQGGLYARLWRLQDLNGERQAEKAEG
jgi:ATP-binding cassette subfamily B protein